MSSFSTLAVLIHALMNGKPIFGILRASRVLRVITKQTKQSFLDILLLGSLVMSVSGSCVYYISLLKSSVTVCFSAIDHRSHCPLPRMAGRARYPALPQTPYRRNHRVHHTCNPSRS